MFKIKSVLTLFICLLCGIPQILIAQADQDLDKLFSISFEDLLTRKIATAGKKQEKVADIPASVVIVTRSQIEKYGFISLQEILENIPGLYAINDYAYNNVVFGARGFWSGNSRNMIIMVNGVSQIEGYASSFLVRNAPVPVEAIDRIEVVRGPMAVIYGGGAFYGVINIITNQNTETEAANTVSVSAGSQSTKKVFLRLSGKQNAFQYTLNASIFDTHGLNVSLSELSSNPPAGVSQNTDGRLENTERYINFSGQLKDISLDVSYLENPREQYFFGASASSGYLNQQTSTIISLGYEKEFTERFSTKAKLTHNKHTLESHPMYTPDYEGIETIDSDVYETELNTFLNLRSNLDITTGVHFLLKTKIVDYFHLPLIAPTLINGTGQLHEDDNILTSALFTQLNYIPSEKLRLVAGVRVQKTPKYSITNKYGIETVVHSEGVYDYDEAYIIPRIAAIYSPHNDHIIKVLYGQATNAPSFSQNYFQYLAGSQSLEPENIRTIELNYITSLSSSVNLNLSLFQNNLDHLITRVHYLDENDEYQSYNDNVGILKTRGAEMSLSTDLKRKFHADLSVTYQNTKNKTTGYEAIDVPYSPKLLGYLKASYTVKQNFVLSLTGHFVDGMESFWNGPPNSSGGRIGEKSPAYLNFGGNLRIEDLFNRGLYLNLRISNFLNSEIRYPAFTNNTWAEKGTLGSGRYVLCSFGMKL